MKITKMAIKFSTSVYVFFLLLVVLGLSAIKEIPLEAFPEVKQPLIFISTVYPGVSPEDMESLVTDKIEKKLKELQHIDEVTSTSAESVSSIVVKFDPAVETEWALNKVKDKVDLAVPDLPKDVDTPLVKELAFDEFPILIINFSGDLSLKKLKDIADDFKEDIEALPGILRADLSGGLEREIQILIDPDRLIAYQVNINAVMQAVSQANSNIPGGVIKVGDLRYTVRVPGEVKDIRRFNNIIIKNQQGTIVYLRDVADIRDGFKDATTISRFNGKESVSLSIVKRSGSNIIEVVDATRKLMKDEINRYPQGLEINMLFDRSQDIKSMVNELSNNLITGVLLVIIILFLFLGFINSLFVAIALPLSMLIGITIFNMMGITLNMIVLFALILALGMLVDNGIVVIENIYRHSSRGVPRQYAAYIGTSEVAWPIIASTATTIAVFFPLLFWDSIMGEVMKYLPIVLISTLSASLFIALVINPVLSATLMRVNKKSLEKVLKSENYEDVLTSSIGMKIYQKILKTAVRFRWVTLGLMFGLLIFTFWFYGKNNRGVIFFPESTPKNATVKIEAPVGTRIEAIDRDYVHAFEKKLEEYPDITAVISDIGVDVNGTMMFAGRSVPHNAKITIRFKKRGEFKKHPLKIIEELRVFASGNQFVGAKIRVEKKQDGPPTGKPIQVAIAGDEFKIAKKHITEMKNRILKNVPGVVDLEDDFTSGMPELQIIPNREKAKLYHLSVVQIASDIRTAIYGGEASKYRVRDDEYDITVRYQAKNRKRIEDLKNMLIPVRVMNRYEIIPLKEIATFKITKGFATIKHTDYKRTITLGGDVQNTTSNKAMTKIKKLFKDKKISGYKIVYGGESKDQAKELIFLEKAFMIALFLILMILITQFNSVLIPLVIMISIVLSLIGVLWSILLTNDYFVVIMSGIGIISLAGIVVNNAIVLIDYIQQLRLAGIPKNDAIIRAGITRFRPVMLTAITTVFGLVPMMFGFNIDFARMHFSLGGSESGEWWTSMANVVGYGLLFATILTLVVVPATYSIFDSLGEGIRKLSRRSPQPFIDEDLKKYSNKF